MRKNVFIASCLSLLFVSCSAAKKVALFPVRVEGTAMLPALGQDDRIFINRSVDELARGDIVVFYLPFDPSASSIKRIVGLPNEKIEVREGKVMVNGQYLNEPYVESKNNLSLGSSPEVRIPADSYYVMGDNRDNSADSRIWGVLQRKLIYGKFVKKYYDAQ